MAYVFAPGHLIVKYILNIVVSLHSQNKIYFSHGK